MSKKQETKTVVTPTKIKNSATKLHKYYKRLLAFMSTQKRNDFKRLMIEAIQSEKAYKENSRKTKEKNTGD